MFSQRFLIPLIALVLLGSSCVPKADPDETAAEVSASLIPVAGSEIVLRQTVFGGGGISVSWVGG